MRTKLSSSLAGLGLLALAACTAVPPPVSEMPDSIANAMTTAEHQGAADFFARKAASYEAEAVWHEKMSRAYATRPKGDAAAMASHCRSIQAYFNGAAKDARALEQAHRQLAASTAK